MERYDVFIGNHERILGTIVYHKYRGEYIPCIVTNFYYGSRKYALVPVIDMENIPVEEHERRRLFYTTKVYVRVLKGNRIWLNLITN